jgi:paraquat-inducible protein A
VSEAIPRVGVPHAQCHACQLVVQISTADAEAAAAVGCPRCSATIHRRKPDSLIRTTAYLIAAAICYIPANLYPIMTSTSLGQSQSDTIFSGVTYLLFHGMWPLAIVVFVASIVVPTVKLIALSALVISVVRESSWRTRERAQVYRIVEAIGRWSMVDVYVVTILVALVHLGAVASVEAELGAFFFGAVVVLTILAAESFDPRLIWDQAEAENEVEEVGLERGGQTI